MKLGIKNKTRELVSLLLVLSIIYAVINFGPDVARAINGELTESGTLEQCENGGIKRTKSLLPIEWLSPAARVNLESCYVVEIPMDFELQD